MHGKDICEEINSWFPRNQFLVSKVDKIRKTFTRSNNPVNKKSTIRDAPLYKMEAIDSLIGSNNPVNEKSTIRSTLKKRNFKYSKTKKNPHQKIVFRK